MVVTNTIIILSAVIALLIASFAGYLFWAQRKFAELEQLRLKASETIRMKLGAYERLTLFVERNKIDNLINRLYQPDWNAASMRQALIANIREEYDHNVTQQLYVEPEIWDAVSRMKDQNIFIINQVGAVLPPEATAMDLNKQLLQLINTDENTTMNKVVLQALQFESKKLVG
jgi:hypothetical protein